NSSASSMVSGMAAQFRSTKGPPARGPDRWMAAATSPLPVPVSPSNRMGGRRRAPSSGRARSRPICSRRATIPGLAPTSRSSRATAQILRHQSRNTRRAVERRRTPSKPGGSTVSCLRSTVIEGLETLGFPAAGGLAFRLHRGPHAPQRNAAENETQEPPWRHEEDGNDEAQAGGPEFLDPRG